MQLSGLDEQSVPDIVIRRLVLINDLDSKFVYYYDINHNKLLRHYMFHLISIYKKMHYFRQMKNILDILLRKHHSPYW